MILFMKIKMQMNCFVNQNATYKMWKSLQERQ